MPTVKCEISQYLQIALEERSKATGESIARIVTTSLFRSLEMPVHTLFQVSTSELSSRESTNAPSPVPFCLTSLTEQRDAANEKLHDAAASFQAVQDELTGLRSQRKQDLIQITSLQGQVGNLTLAVNDQGKRAKSDEEYLASDKDVRDLIGARNLYIADIMDVSETGQSRKPFGRVFYTKTKSLIFYAYDLDRQPGVKQTSTFHVWGSTNAKNKEPINLGLLYMDSETNRRWTP